MRALFSAASGMSAQQTKLETIANNLANVGTNGYKKSRAEFEDLFYQELTYGGKAASVARVEVGSGVALGGIEKDHAQGALEQTGNPLHMAVQGDGYFVLETNEGEPVYTRDGSFTLDQDGVLISSSGLVVGGGIVVPRETVQLEVMADGTVAAILAGDVDHTILGQVELAGFVNPAGLRPIGGNLFAQTPESGDAQPVDPQDGVRVMQGFLERSNVDVAEELINMIMTQRAYELNSKVVQASDETLQVATNLRR